MRKVLQHAVFAALAAWVGYGAQARLQDAPEPGLNGARTSSFAPGRF